MPGPFVLLLPASRSHRSHRPLSLVCCRGHSNFTAFLLNHTHMPHASALCRGDKACWAARVCTHSSQCVPWCPLHAAADLIPCSILKSYLLNYTSSRLASLPCSLALLSWDTGVCSRSSARAVVRCSNRTIACSGKSAVGRKHYFRSRLITVRPPTGALDGD